MTLKIKKSEGLQIEPEAKFFNENFLKIQRIGFSIMMILIFASFLGVLGSGLLSHTEITHGNLNIVYEKFIRQQATTIIKINLNNNCKTENMFSMSKHFFEKISIKSINPMPFKEISSNDAIQYYFYCDSSENVPVTLIIEPEQFGLLQANIEVGNDKILMNQFVYP